MLSQTVLDAINQQIKHEFDSAYVYLSMVAYFEAEDLPGMAQWMRAQAQEELSHGMRLFDYINDRGGRVVLQAVDVPPAEFESPLQAFESALNHERKITLLIHELYGVAQKENDLPTQVELQWFITEQVEEEKSADLIVQHLKRIGNDQPALLLLDRELGQRKMEDEG